MSPSTVASMLRPGAPIPVRFTGSRAAAGPLTLGQLNIWQWLSGVPEHLFATIGAELAVPQGTRVNDVVQTIAVLLARHEGLRTTYDAGPPPTQRVHAEGVLPIDVYTVDGEPAGQRVLTGELLSRLRSGARPDPMRVAIVAHGDTVLAAAALFSHYAVDNQAMEVVRREFATLLPDPATRLPGPPRHQPLDRVEAERAPAAARQAEQTLDYWRDLLTRMPPCLYATPRVATGESVAVGMTSVAAAVAARGIAARTRASRAGVIMAAVCAVLARRTGYRELVFPTLSSNRFQRELVDYVGTLAQGSLIAVATDAGGFDALVKRVWTATLQAGRHGTYDVYRRVAMAQRIEHERGVRFDYEPLFNNAAIEPATGGAPRQDPRAVRELTRLRCRDMPPNGAPIRFDLYQTDPVVRLDLWTGDTGRVSRDEMRSVLLAVENLLVAAADGDIASADLAAAMGVAPIERGPDWRHIDSCWVELTQVRRLVAEALAPAVTHVFSTVDGEQLVAYVVASDAVPDAAHAHELCMAALPGRPTAIAPRRYVLCERAPEDPTRLDDWRAVQAAPVYTSTR